MALNLRLTLRALAACALRACAVVLAFGIGTAAAAPQGGAPEALKSVDQFQSRAQSFADPEKLPGARLYRAHCASCHEGQVAKAPHRSWLELVAADSILAAMTDGIMQAEAAGLSARQKRQVTEYLTRQPFDPKAVRPEPPRCSAERAAFDLGRPPPRVNWGHDTKRFVPAEIAGLALTDIPRLTLKWAFAYPGAIRGRSQPAIGYGAVFVGSQDGTVYAFDLETGCVRWTYRASAEVRSAVVLEADAAEGSPRRLFFGDLIGRVYALDALSGALLWMVRADDHPNATITGAPAVQGGRLHVPVSSLEVVSAADPAYACCTFRGAILALDTATGETVWKSHTIPEPPQEQGTTSVGTPILGPSGAPIWNSPAIDARRGLVFAGTGENYSSPADGHSNAVFAFDLATGARRWHRQTLPGDAWNVACMMADNPNCPREKGPDLDYGASMLLIERGWPRRDILVAGQKTGIAYGLDPDTGALRWETRVGRGSTQGGIHFGMAAEGRRVYVPVSDMNDTGDGKVYDIAAGRAGIHALDAASGRILWRHVADNVCAGRRYCDPGISSAVTAVPGAVFAGHLDGRLRAYDGATGAVLWETDTTRPVDTVNGIPGQGGSMSGAGPAIAEGHVVLNSGYGLYFHMPGNVLLVYAAGGR